MSANYDLKTLDALREERDSLFNMLKLTRPETAKCLESEFCCLDERLNTDGDPGNRNRFVPQCDRVLNRLGFDEKKRDYYCDAMVLTVGVKVLRDLAENTWKAIGAEVDRKALAGKITTAIETTAREFMLAAARAELAECESPEIGLSSKRLRAHKIAMQSMIALYETGSFQVAMNTMAKAKDNEIARVGSRESYDDETTVPLNERETIDKIIQFVDKNFSYKETSDDTKTKADLTFLKELLNLTVTSNPPGYGSWNFGVGYDFCSLFVFSGLLKD